MQANNQRLKLEQRLATLPPIKRGRYPHTLDENKKYLEGNPYTFTTTNKHFHIEHPPIDFSASKANFKKKTPLTQWSNAYFSGGVHFNPPA